MDLALHKAEIFLSHLTLLLAQAVVRVFNLMGLKTMVVQVVAQALQHLQ